MEASTVINKMLAGNKIFVPSYQRAYSWETPFEDSKLKTQTDVFLSDLEDYNKSSAKTPYYFGHFLFEEKTDGSFGVIDGQQRLTTIIIFLSALFSKLESIRALTENEEVLYENMIKRKSNYIFSTVDYDNQFFKDYVVDRIKKSKSDLETESARRIANAFDFFVAQLSDKDNDYLVKMLKTISEASCTTHPVVNESEAIQMFIFQNNRGKKPSNLEILKAQFMFNVHLYAGDEKDALIAEIKNRFEKIYKSISSIEYKINEDDVLVYTLRVYFNSLWEENAIDKINKVLSEGNPIPFIKLFTFSLASSFEHLTTFFGKDERSHLEIHSLIMLGGFGIAIPFIIKAYTFGLSKIDICQISSTLESLILRHRLIGTRAEIISRINDVYQQFTSDHTDIKPIIERINVLKNAADDSGWWGYWNLTEFEKSLQGGISHATAKFLLWKYENHLRKHHGKGGYSPMRYDEIPQPELEHIAPQTPTDGKPLAAGYCDYDEEFINHYLNCIGNYLLLSKPHNSSIGNKPFKDKRATYSYLEQQREIQKLVPENGVWDKNIIKTRKYDITKYLLSHF